MPLLDGIGRSTQIGDMGAFFLGCSAMILLGAATRRPHWLQAAAMLVGGAAIVRTLAWAFHDAAFATQFIAVELVVTGVLLFGAHRFTTRA